MGCAQNSTSEKLNTAIATVIFKGKSKGENLHSSYRLVRVLPQFKRIFDDYVRPVLCKITKPSQNPNQYGFTSGISYLLDALQRHELEQLCMDQKQKTFFAVSSD